MCVQLCKERVRVRVFKEVRGFKGSRIRWRFVMERGVLKRR